MKFHSQTFFLFIDSNKNYRSWNVLKIITDINLVGSKIIEKFLSLSTYLVRISLIKKTITRSRKIIYEIIILIFLAIERNMCNLFTTYVAYLTYLVFRFSSF